MGKRPDFSESSAPLLNPSPDFPSHSLHTLPQHAASYKDQGGGAQNAWYSGKKRGMRARGRRRTRRKKKESTHSDDDGGGQGSRGLTQCDWSLARRLGGPSCGEGRQTHFELRRACLWEPCLAHAVKGWSEGEEGGG